MSQVDVNAVNERLNGLVTLLQAVGIDSGDVGALAKNLGPKNNNNNNNDAAAEGQPRQLNDEQIEAIIRKLQQAQQEAPQIIAALEAHAEARSIGGGKPPAAQQQQQDDDDDDETEEDDDDANYPMVGPGISDDISVVSDLTTPTVVQGVNVPEEELYKETLPPMLIGGGGTNNPPMMLNPTKRKNLVNSVRPTPPNRRGPPPPSRPTGPKRRPAPGRGGPRPSRPAPGAASPNTSSRPPPKKKIVKKKPPPQQPPQRRPQPKRFEPDWDNNNNNGGWNAFETSPAKPKTNNASATVIDTDGFLVADAGFDPFAVAPTFTNNTTAAGDLAFSSTKPRRKAPAARNKEEEDAARNQREATFAQLRGGAARPRRARRASLDM